MAHDPYFPFFYVDFIHGTQFFTDATVGAYVRALCVQWEQGFVESEIFSAIGNDLTEKEFHQLSRKFLPIKIKDVEGFQNKKMEETRRYVKKIKKINSENGKLGGYPTQKRNRTEPSTETIPGKYPLNLKSEILNPKAKSLKLKTEEEDIFGTKFEEFWSLVPARNGKRKFKPKAWEIFGKIKIEELNLVLQATRNFAESKDVKEGLGIPDPHRFLHSIENRCDPWRDWIEPENPTAQMSKTERNAQSLLEKLKAGRQPTIVNP